MFSESFISILSSPFLFRLYYTGAEQKNEHTANTNRILFFLLTVSMLCYPAH